MRTGVSAGAGFLLAVLWFDLMFDVQVLRNGDGDLPPDTLASISGYYRRVTTDARPMNRLVAAVMVATVACVIIELSRGTDPTWVAWASLPLVITPVALAGGRTVPSAVRLGTGRDPQPHQSVLARSIFRDHLVCLVSIAFLLVVQLVPAS